MTDEPTAAVGPAAPAMSAPSLRERAEAVYRDSSSGLDAMTMETAQRLVHELRVHQIELEMQNEELRLSQVSLGESRARYLDLYDFAPIGYCSLSAEGLVLQSNLRFATLLGRARGVLIGQPFFKFIFNADQHLFYRHRQLLTDTRAPQSVELRIMRSDGTKFWAQLELDVQCMDGQEEIRLIVADISQRVEADASLRLLGTAVEQVAASVVMTDLAGNIEYVNPAFELVTGYSRAEALGKNPRILKSGGQSDEIYRELWATISAGKTWEGRLVNLSKTGRLFTEETLIAPVRDHNGTICNYLAVKRDVTVELSLQQQLVQAQKLESIGRLAGGIAHDFNNILAVILADVEDISPPNVPWAALVAERAGEIGEAATRARNLTRQLLTFARRQVFSLVVLDLNEAVRGIEKMLGRLVGADILVTTELAALLWPVLCDQSQFEQVLLNFAVNARDAMPRGGALTLRTANLAADSDGLRRYPGAPSRDHVQFSVSDSGIGMSAEVQARLFEPFFTTKEVGKGTGLGLATVYGIVKQSGGYIRCESEQGRGTTFSICLPRAPATAATQSAPMSSLVKRGGKETILLVEDDAGIRRFIERTLIGAGYQVRVAGNGAAALVLAREPNASFDLLLSDVIMPGLDGGQLLEQLRQSRPRLRVLFVSGYPGEVLSAHGIEPSSAEWLQKPFSGAELLAHVRRSLDPH